MVRGNPLTIAQYLTNVTEHNSTDKGSSVTGKARDYSVFINDAGISLKGSLPKFLLTNNIQTLSRAEASQAIEKLSNTLHLPIKKSKVTRIDVSTVLLVDQPPCNYYPFLGNKPHFERLQATKDTLYYNTNKRQLAFYDKVAEAKAKKIKIPETFIGKNLLRFEARYKNRLPTQFNMPIITGETLTNERFYNGIVKRWGDEYFSINKLKSISIMDTSTIKTPNDAKEVLFSFLLQNAGVGSIDRYLADLKAKKTFKDPKYYTRIKNLLHKYINAKTKSENSDLINKLDKAVNEVLINHR